MNNRKGLFRVVSLGIAMMLAASGCMAAQATDAAQEEVPEDVFVAPVETVFLDKTTIRNELTYIGQVQPQSTVNIIPMLSAEVTAVNYDLGDRIEAGDVLFTLDAKDIHDQVRQLQVALQAQSIGIESAQYALQLAIDGSAQQRLTELQYESGIDQTRYASSSAGQQRYQAEKAHEAAEAALENAEAAERAAREMLAAFEYAFPRPFSDITDPDTGIVVKSAAELNFEYNQLKSAVSTASSYVNQADNAVTQAYNAMRLAGIGRSQADTAYDTALETYDAYIEVAEQGKEQAAKQAEFGVRSAEAQLATTQLQLSIAQSNLERAIVTSPVSGVVSVRNVEVGQMVGPTSMPFVIVQMDPVVVQVGVSETLINKLSPGDEVTVSIQALESEKPLTGVIKAVSPSASATGTYPVKVELSNPDGAVKPGMFSQVTFVEAQKSNTYVVDKSVVLQDEVGSYVYTVKDGMAVKTPVVTGLSGGKLIELASGVTGDDELVVVGQEYLYNEVPVNVVSRDGQRTAG